MVVTANGLKKTILFETYTHFSSDKDKSYRGGQLVLLVNHIVPVNSMIIFQYSTGMFR